MHRPFLIEKKSLDLFQSNRSFSLTKVDSSKLNRLSIPTETGFAIVSFDEIIYCEALRSYCRFTLRNNRCLTTSKALLNYEAPLLKQNFFRIHKSYLINLYHVREYVRGAGGLVIMSNGIELGVSRRKKEEFLRRISQFF